MLWFQCSCSPISLADSRLLSFAILSQLPILGTPAMIHRPNCPYSVDGMTCLVICSESTSNTLFCRSWWWRAFQGSSSSEFLIQIGLSSCPYELSPLMSPCVSWALDCDVLAALKMRRGVVIIPPSV